MYDSNIIDRFWSKVDVKGEDDCWQWHGTIMHPRGKHGRGGYGNIYVNGGKMLAHRLSWVIANGSIPEGLWVLHTCHNRACVNPTHLYVGTAKDNTRDAIVRGTQYKHQFPKGQTHNKGHTRSRGELNSQAKLTELEVREIRSLYSTGNYTQTELGRRYGVTPPQISHIVNLKTWQYLGVAQ